MEESFERAPPAAVPPLDYQVGVVDAIVLAVTELSGGAVTYRVREAWKGAAVPGSRLALDTRMHELLGYRPAQGQEVVLLAMGVTLRRRDDDTGWAGVVPCNHPPPWPSP